jgi:hypothetical protein
MARSVKVEEELVPAKVTTKYSEEITCDKCGRVIDAEEPPEGNEDLYAQVLEIYLNADLCVNSRIKYDFCRTCLDPIWKKICEAIGVDPDDEHRVGQDD